MTLLSMTGSPSGGTDVQARPERRSARMVLDVDFALDWPLTEVLRGELDQGVEVHVVLLHRRLGWSVGSALAALRPRRIAAARRSRLEELARIAGARHRQVFVSIQRHRWLAAAHGHSLAQHLTDRSDREGPVLR